MPVVVWPAATVTSFADAGFVHAVVPLVGVPAAPRPDELDAVLPAGQPADVVGAVRRRLRVVDVLPVPAVEAPHFHGHPADAGARRVGDPPGDAPRPAEADVDARGLGPGGDRDVRSGGQRVRIPSYHSSRYSPLSAPLHGYGHLSTALRRYLPVPTPPIE